MVNIKKQIDLWKAGAAEDLAAAKQLVENNKVRHGLFFAHLATEKLLKANISNKTNDLAPRIHNLARLAELGGISLNSDQQDFFAELNIFQIEGRYPELLAQPPSTKEAYKYIERTEELFQWLMNLL
ncbi:MAG: HEPN domain-containing protein [Candidatus Schekmanbacteria bacterium]|nr:HEPN domain-containing protein [Candidatus Schekmanbacteria bacterium]